jgi:hypothetical protein
MWSPRCNVVLPWPLTLIFGWFCDWLFTRPEYRFEHGGFGESKLEDN